MNKSFFVGILIFIFSLSLFAQQTEEKQLVQEKEKAKKVENPVYYGGTLGLSFGNYFRISVVPMVGYKLSRDASVGFKVGYAYTEDKRYDEKITSHNYGGSVFTRYRVHPKLYAHAEFAYWSYKYQISSFETDRTWVPFLLLGGGFIQPISSSSVFIVEVLFDVLQDDNSPYEDWSPWISVGVGVGF